MTFPASDPAWRMAEAGRARWRAPRSIGTLWAMANKEERQVEHIEERSTPRTPVIYEIVRRYGEEEMERPATSLWWSGLAAGLSMSFSLLAMAILEMHLSDAE